MINKMDVAKILFRLDPMNTACFENDLTDEYSSEAAEIAGLINDSGFIKIDGIIKVVFDKCFWVDCLSQETIETIEKEILLLQS